MKALENLDHADLAGRPIRLFGRPGRFIDAKASAMSG
jgi:hypothetical protein